MLLTKRSAIKLLEDTFEGDIGKKAVEDYKKEQREADSERFMARETVPGDQVKLVAVEDLTYGDRVVCADGLSCFSSTFWVDAVVWCNVPQDDGTFWIVHGSAGQLLKPEVAEQHRRDIIEQGPHLKFGGGMRINPGTKVLVATHRMVAGGS